MADDPLPHTRSEGLKRLLRRRGRRGKVGANTGEKIQIHAWHSRSQFTPSGVDSVRWLGALLAAVGLLLLAWWIGFFLWSAVTSMFADDLTVFEKIWVLPTITVLMSAPIWLTALIAWIYMRLDGNGKRDTERLIARADKLRLKRGEAQDEGANRAR
ncbi:MAG TPA: hypothetical protein PK417_15250 [Hyphomonas sp.]|nr:hypothetical protein [Hyphomonas sp.]